MTAQTSMVNESLGVGRPAALSSRSCVCDRCGHRQLLCAMDELTDFSTVPPIVRRVCTDVAFCDARLASRQQNASGIRA